MIHSWNNLISKTRNTTNTHNAKQAYSLLIVMHHLLKFEFFVGICYLYFIQFTMV